MRSTAFVTLVDANVLVYAANDDSPAQERCRSLLHGLGAGDEPWYLTWGIVYEFFRVTTHPNILPRPLSPVEAQRFVAVLMSYRSCEVLSPTNRHLAVLREVLVEVPDVSGNLMFDVRTAVLMREHGIRRIVTHDRDFARFPFLEVVDPLA